MLFVLLLFSVSAFFFGSLPLAKWVVSALTIGGKISDERYIATIRVFTDIAKGAMAVAVGHEVGFEGAHLAAICVYLGHIFPLRDGFGQQNGTGALLGALILLDPLVGLTAISAWFFAYYIYRHAAFSAVVSAGMTTLICGFIPETSQVRVELLILMAAIVFWRHRHFVFIRG